MLYCRMMFQVVAIFVFSLVGSGILPIQPALAQGRLSPVPIEWNQPEFEGLGTPTNPSIYFLSAGPMENEVDQEDPTRWRLALSCDEIYCGITFDYIQLQQEFEGLPKIVSSYRLNGADIAPLIDVNNDFLSKIRFTAWETWDRVLMREDERYFQIQINPDQSFDIIPEEEI